MNTQVDIQAADPWHAFCELNGNRRAIRAFDDRPIPDDTVRALLEQAMLAPSSVNLQSYQFHWLRDPARKAAVAEACNGQAGATTAATLIVMVAGVSCAMDTADSMRRYVTTTDELDEKSKKYHLANLRKAKTAFSIMPLPLWNPLKALLTLFFPSLTLMPIGSSGIRHWAARNALPAAQTLLLAASARGIDSCPMEGFNARVVAKLLGLPRGAVIPMVIALGYRAPGARMEPRWRRSFDEAVAVH